MLSSLKPIGRGSPSDSQSRRRNPSPSRSPCRSGAGRHFCDQEAADRAGEGAADTAVAGHGPHAPNPDRRDQDLSVEEIQAAYEEFTELWEELTFDERQYALRLLIKEIRLSFRKKEKEGQIKIEAWGRRPQPLKISLERTKKLRNQNRRLPREDSNL